MELKGTYSVIFRYNERLEKWECFHRVEYNQYWNNRASVTLGTGYSPETALANWKHKYNKARLNEHDHYLRDNNKQSII